jgi:chromosomal replication initiation ATPase DnaA
MPIEQMPLALDQRPGMTRADFVVSASNEEAVSALDRWADWAGAALVVSGPAGAGKSHLAAIWRETLGAREIAPDRLVGDAVPALLVGASAIFIDNVDRAAEEPLLHVFNMIGERRGHLLLVARDLPARWNIALPDLRSRLLSSRSVTILPPDEELLRGVLVKLFSDRQLIVAGDVIGYLVLHLERSYAAAIRAVAALDAAALVEGRRVTVPLARRILGFTSQ